MVRLRVEEWIYTWARAHETGSGFGVVLRTTGWPSKLFDSDELRSLLMTMEHGQRIQNPRPGLTYVFSRHVGSGTLLVAKTPVGEDGAGRPGNYVVHAIYDQSGSLGALDLVDLVGSGAFETRRLVDHPPQIAVPPREFDVPDSWAHLMNEAHGEQMGPTIFDQNDFGSLASVEAALLRGCTVAPADLVNQVEINSARDASQVVSTFKFALPFGATESNEWWQRRNQSQSYWIAEVRELVANLRPPQDLSTSELVEQWRTHSPLSDLRHAAVCAELVDRWGAGSGAVEALRPSLVSEALADDLLAAGLRANRLEAVASIASTAGSPASLIAVANQLAQHAPTRINGELAARLLALDPAQMSPAAQLQVLQTVQQGSKLSTPWQQACAEAWLADPGHSLPTDLQANILGQALGKFPDAEHQRIWDRMTTELGPQARNRAFACSTTVGAWRVLERGFDDVDVEDVRKHLSLIWPSLVTTMRWHDKLGGALEPTEPRRRRGFSLSIHRIWILIGLAMGLATVAVGAWLHFN